MRGPWVCSRLPTPADGAWEETHCWYFSVPGELWSSPWVSWRFCQAIWALTLSPAVLWGVAPLPVPWVLQQQAGRRPGWGDQAGYGRRVGTSQPFLPSVCSLAGLPFDLLA